MYNLSYHIVSFATALYSDNVLIENTYINHHNDKLRNLFNSLTDLTLKQDLLTKLR